MSHNVSMFAKWKSNIEIEKKIYLRFNVIGLIYNL